MGRQPAPLPAGSSRRRSLTALLLLAASLAGCAAWLGPRTIVISDAELSQRLATRFPLERRWLELFELRMSNPRVSSDARSGRLRVEVDIGVGQRLIDHHLAARLLVSVRPRYEAGDHSIRITDVSVDARQIDGAAASMLGGAAPWVSALLAQVLEDRTIYRLNASQLAEIERQGLVLRKLVVGERGLELGFEPA